MQKLTVSIQGLQGQKSATEITQALKKYAGVCLVTIDTEHSIGNITYDDLKITPLLLIETIQSLGYETAETEAEEYATKPRIRMNMIIFVLLFIVACCYFLFSSQFREDIKDVSKQSIEEKMTE